jgi:hypothetical protein
MNGATLFVKIGMRILLWRKINWKTNEEMVRTNFLAEQV